MKRILSLSLTVFALFLLSCTNKAIPTPKFIGWEPLDYIQGGGLDVTAYVYSFPEKELHNPEKELHNLEDLVICIWMTPHRGYFGSSADYANETYKRFYSELKTKVEQLVGDEYYLFFYAGINGAVSITCDKRIDGRDPGENLADLFQMIQIPLSQRLRLTYGTFDNPIIIKDEPIGFSEYFYDGSTLPRGGWCVKMNSVSGEMPDECTFTIKIPVETETWANYGWDIPLEMQTPPKRVLRGHVKVSKGQTLLPYTPSDHVLCKDYDEEYWK